MVRPSEDKGLLLGALFRSRGGVNARRGRETITGGVNRFLLGGLSGAVLVGLVLVAVLAIAGLRISDEDVKVPSLLDDKPSVAQAKVEAVGLKVRLVRSSPPADPLGLLGPARAFVTRQVPESGQLIRSDGTVTLFVGYR